MDRCGGCDKPMRPKQARCSCGWKAFGAKDFVSPRHGLCEYNDHGMSCGNAGAIALHNGEGGPWYCSNHALGLKGMKKIDASKNDGHSTKKENKLATIEAYVSDYIANNPKATKRDACIEFLKEKQLFKNLPKSLQDEESEAEAEAERKAIQEGRIHGSVPFTFNERDSEVTKCHGQ